MSTTSPSLVAEQLALPPLGVAKLLGISKAQIWKLLGAGKFPRPIYLGTRLPRWRPEELRAWLAAGAPDQKTWEERQGMNSGEN